MIAVLLIDLTLYPVIVCSVVTHLNGQEIGQEIAESQGHIVVEGRKVNPQKENKREVWHWIAHKWGMNVVDLEARAFKSVSGELCLFTHAVGGDTVPYHPLQTAT